MYGRQLGQRLAAEIRAEMARQGRSRRWLAEQIGESHVTVGRWVKGETPMNVDAVDVIARALGLTVIDLLAAVERNGGYEPRALVNASAREAAVSRQVSAGDTRWYLSLYGLRSRTVHVDQAPVPLAA